MHTHSLSRLQLQLLLVDCNEYKYDFYLLAVRLLYVSLSIVPRRHRHCRQFSRFRTPFNRSLGHIVIDRNLHAHERVSLCAEHPLTHNLVDDTDIADGQIYRIVVEFPSPHTERNRMEKRNGCEGMMIL